MIVPLHLARHRAVGPMPLGSAATWCACHGYVEHPHVDVAAAHVVACERARPDTPPAARARILSVADDAGLSVAEEAAALERARACYGGP